MNLLLLSLLWSGPVSAQECDPVPEALEDLDAVVSSFYGNTDGASEYCPTDLTQPVDMEDADSRAGQMDAESRNQAAALLLEAVSGLGSEHVQSQANGAALLDALLGAGLEAGDDISSILDALLQLAEETEDPLLHRQITLNLWRHGVEDERVEALLEIYLPKSPDYDKIFADGRTEVTAVLRTGYDGFAHSDIKGAFESKGAELLSEESNQTMEFRYEVKPDDPSLPTITWTIKVVNNSKQYDGAFVDMDDDELEVTMFGDHSQLGTSLDNSLLKAPKAEDSTDFFWVDACKSKVFTSRLSQAFPAGHFVYTKDSEYFMDMPVSYERGLVALANRYDYEEMRRLVAAGSAWQSKNYLFPDDEQKLVFQDQDGDGIADAEDRLYNVAEPGEPSGELASRAVHIANTYMGYSEAFQYYSARTERVVEDAYRPDGIFDGEPDGPAIQIERREDVFGEEKYFVAVNDELLKIHQTERTALIAAEMTRFQSLEWGWDEKVAEAAGYLMGAAVFDVWSGGEWDSFQDRVMPGLELSSFDAAEYLDDHNFVVNDEIYRFVTEQMTPPPQP